MNPADPSEQVVVAKMYFFPKQCFELFFLRPGFGVQMFLIAIEFLL